MKGDQSDSDVRVTDGKDSHKVPHEVQNCPPIVAGFIPRVDVQGVSVADAAGVVDDEDDVQPVDSFADWYCDRKEKILLIWMTLTLCAVFKIMSSINGENNMNGVGIVGMHKMQKNQKTLLFNGSDL